MIERLFDGRRINSIINDPSVYPWVCGSRTDPLDVSPLVDNPQNVALFGEHGGCIFLQHQPGLYEAHTQVLPAGRGKWTLKMVRAALHWMFTRTDAVEIVTRCPHGNVASKALAKLISGVHEFTHPQGWVLSGVTVPADIYALRIQDWIRTGHGLIERGQWFHDRLEEEYEKIGRAQDFHEHEDDQYHYRCVGAAVDMVLGGQPAKGVVFYNRWAQMAGGDSIKIAGIDPLIIDIKDCLLFVRNNDFWAMPSEF